MDVPFEPGKVGRVQSHWPLRSEPDEVMSAKQLADACVEALTDEDRKYALEAAGSFLRGLDSQADSRALIALLCLPPDDDADRLLAEVERRLAERAPAVVGALLRVVVEGDHPACDNAAAALDQTLETDLAQGLIEVLEDDTNDGMKRAAAAALITLGPPAADQIAAALEDPDIRDWVTEAAGCPLDAADDEVMEAIECGSACDDSDGAEDDEVAAGSAGQPADDATGDDSDSAGADGGVAASAPDDVAAGDASASWAGEAGDGDANGDEAAEEVGVDEGGSDPADEVDPEADLERGFAAYEREFQAFDEHLKRSSGAD